jgi:subtilisin-like proprotein convertase family protein
VFDDAAATTIAAGVAPFAGSFKPESPLSAFNGKPSNGTWKLHVVDTANEDVATVGCVTLEINKQFVCCGIEIAAGCAGICGDRMRALVPQTMHLTRTRQLPLTSLLKNNGGSAATNLVATLQPGGGVLRLHRVRRAMARWRPARPQAGHSLLWLRVSCGGTIAATLALQDGATVLAPITINIPIGTTSSSTQSFSNTTAIYDPVYGYRCYFWIAGNSLPVEHKCLRMTGTVSKVTVTIPSVSHSFPSDVDMLLVGPGGQKYVFLSDVIGSTGWTNNSYTLDDAAAALIPSSADSGIGRV